MLKKLPGFKDFNAMLEVLRLLRCGFGLKDAPRLWNKLLTQELRKIGLKPLQSDPQLYVWHENESARRSPSGGAPPASGTGPKSGDASPARSQVSPAGTAQAHTHRRPL